MPEEQLPSLPEPNFVDCDGSWFKSDRMHAYGRECFRLGALAERKRAAKICDERAETWDGDPPEGQECEWNWMRDEARNCAAAIRKEPT